MIKKFISEFCRNARFSTISQQKFNSQELQRSFAGLQKKHKDFFEDYRHFFFEYERFDVFSKKKFESCRAFYRDLREFQPKNCDFFEELLTNNSKNQPILNNFLFFKENIAKIRQFLPQICNEELIFLLFLCENLGILPDDFLKEAFENLKFANFSSLNAKSLKKLIEIYSKVNFSHEKLQHALFLRLEREISQENLFSLNKIHEFFQGLSLLCAWKFEETRFFHEFFLQKLEKYLQNSQFIQRNTLKFLWNLLETMLLMDSSCRKTVLSLKNQLPFHKKFLFQSKFQHSFKEILAEICKENCRIFEEERRILCYFVDFFVEPDKIIEINGVSHYVDYTSRRKWTFDEVRLTNLKRLNHEVFEFSLLDFEKIDKKKSKKYVIFKKFAFFLII